MRGRGTETVPAGRPSWDAALCRDFSPAFVAASRGARAAARNSSSPRIRTLMAINDGAVISQYYTYRATSGRRSSRMHAVSDIRAYASL